MQDAILFYFSATIVCFTKIAAALSLVLPVNDALGNNAADDRLLLARSLSPTASLNWRGYVEAAVKNCFHSLSHESPSAFSRVVPFTCRLLLSLALQSLLNNLVSDAWTYNKIRDLLAGWIATTARHLPEKAKYNCLQHTPTLNLLYIPSE